MTTEQFIRDIISLQPAMRRMAELLLHDRDLAADAVQETLTRLWTKRWKLGRIDDKKNYCLRSLRNECIDMLRKQRHLTNIEQLADTLPAPPLQEALDAEEKYLQLENAISQLTPIQQQIVRLKFIENRSTKEIATLTGLSASNVDTIMSRTYTILREKIQ